MYYVICEGNVINVCADCPSETELQQRADENGGDCYVVHGIRILEATPRHFIRIGSVVIVQRDCPGVEWDGVEYGRLNEGDRGTVVGHTVDGRLRVEFGDYFHTFDADTDLLRLPSKPLPL